MLVAVNRFQSQCRVVAFEHSGVGLACCLNRRYWPLRRGNCVTGIASRELRRGNCVAGIASREFVVHYRWTAQCFKSMCQKLSVPEVCDSETACTNPALRMRILSLAVYVSINRMQNFPCLVSWHVFVRGHSRSVDLVLCLGARWAGRDFR
jgi:hypothetical protein